MWAQSLGREDPLDEEMATHSRILTWKMPRTEEPGRLSLWGPKASDMTEQLSTHIYPYSVQGKG